MINIDDVYDTLNDFYKELKNREYEQDFLDEYKLDTNAIDSIEDYIFYELIDFFEEKFSNKEKYTVINANDFIFKLKINNLLTDDLEKFIDNYIKYESEVD